MRTNVRSSQIEDGGVIRDDLNTATAGKAVIRKAVEGTGVTLSSTGADAGTGDVTIATRAASDSVAGHVTTGAQTFAGAKTHASQYAAAEHDNGASGAATKTIDWNEGNCQRVQMTGNCIFVFSNGIAGARYLLRLVGDATALRTPTWPATVYWANDTAPTLSGTTKTDLIAIYFTGTSYLATVAPAFNAIL